jgi:hypothetical protein
VSAGVRRAGRLLLLYLRARQVPATLAMAAASAAIARGLDLATGGRAGAALALLAVVAGVAASASGLAGADPDLERTAALRWPPRRVAHVVVAAAVIAALVVVAALPWETRQLARDVSGLTGLAALAAVTIGAPRAWIAPLTWALLALADIPSLLSPPPVLHEALRWMLQPAGSGPAAATAIALAAAGTLAYAILGARR